MRCRPTSRAWSAASTCISTTPISPIVLAETIDRTKVFRAVAMGLASLLGAAERGAEVRQPDPRCGVDDGQGDYLNCPLTREEYERFYDALVHAESATVHDFDKERFFEGCLPIEVMAHRGPDTLRFGPMKPVGLLDPRTGRPPYAAVQLRQDNLAGRSLQPRRLSDTDQVGRAGARAAA